MGKSYISPLGIAKNVSKIFHGDPSGRAQHFDKGYIGDRNGIARIIFGVDGPSPILPDEYQQVEYIESTGTQYINTGLVHVANRTAMIAKLQFPSEPAANCHNGISYDGSNDVNFTYGFIKTNSKFYMGIRFSDSVGSVSLPYDTAVHEFVHDLKNKVMRIDDTSRTLSGTVNTISGAKGESVLFASRSSSVSGNTIEAYCSQRLYSFKWYNNSVLTRNLYPCYRKSDGVIGLFDMMQKVFYTNDGTGTFLKGPNHVEEL